MSVHTVSATFKFKTIEGRDTFINILKGNDGFIKTRQFKGCQMIECYISNSNDKHIILWEKWDAQSDHEAYLEMRKNAGLFDLLGDLLEEPLDIVRMTHVRC